MKVVIVGGGFGGVDAALKLANQQDIHVTLISKSQNFEYHAALYRSATGRSPREVVIPLDHIFNECHNIDIYQEEITKLEPQNKRVVSETGNVYNYDVLILSLGQVINYFGIEGLEQNSFSLDSITNTIALREHLRDIVLDDDKTNPHFTIVGAGASGVELAAELNIFARAMAKESGKMQKEFGVTLVEGANRVLPALNPKISKRAHKRLRSLGVDLQLGQRVKSVTNSKIVLDSGSLDSDTVVWTAGNQNNPFFKKHEHLFHINKNSRVEVDEYLQARQDVYVIGDSADTTYSGMAQTALYHAAYVSEDILNRRDSQSRMPFTPKVPIYVIPVGPHFAVFQSKHLIFSGYIAWIFRRTADFRLFSQFQPLKEAVKTWRKGNQKATYF